MQTHHCCDQRPISTVITLFLIDCFLHLSYKSQGCSHRKSKQPHSASIQNFFLPIHHIYMLPVEPFVLSWTTRGASTWRRCLLRWFLKLQFMYRLSRVRSNQVCLQELPM